MKRCWTGLLMPDRCERCSSSADSGGVLVFDLVCVTMTVLLSWRLALPTRYGPQATA
ncbi:hypothetical protein ACWD01_04075 [Streptomyces sp. NPDC002835]|jgi:hypothetical protein